MKIYGAYVHARPDGRIFYVGKGTETRAHNLRRNAHHGNIVNKHGAENIQVGFIPCSSEAIAFDLEIGLIKCLRRSGIALTNRTDGGDGTAGMRHTPNTRMQMSASHTGVPLSQTTRDKISASSRGKPKSAAHIENKRIAEIGKHHTAAARAKVSASLIGNKRSLGYKHTAETRAKVSAAGRNNLRALGNKHTSEFKQRKSDAMKGNTQTKGFKHMNDGETIKSVHPSKVDALLQQGWALGGLPRKGKK